LPAHLGNTLPQAEQLNWAVGFAKSARMPAEIAA
jgi:hypothetical protein